jgi:hypothetical protein
MLRRGYDKRHYQKLFCVEKKCVISRKHERFWDFSYETAFDTKAAF